MAHELRDITIIGAGPTGLFGLFYAGMRQVSAQIVDALPEVGGQLAALYPEKFIFDVAGFSQILAKDLVRALVEQNKRFDGKVHLSQRVTGLEKDGDHFVLVTETDRFPTRSLLIAAGIGAFSPRRLPHACAEPWYGRGIYDVVTDPERFRGQRVVIIGGVSVMILVVGGHAIINGTMTTGELFTYVVMVGMMVAPLVQISSISTQISEAFAGLDRIHEIRSVATEDSGDATRSALANMRGSVKFDHVWFEYNEGMPVLQDIEFDAPAGTTTALVGPSGSGKSTLVGLVMAFYRPLKGQVLIDGIDLTTLRLRDYRQSLGVVMQDNFLFDGTVRENIAFARPDATIEEIKAASHVAHCDEFIDRWEEGYDTIVGERGVKLSGGQRQRVAIARAILADPRLLILDEATSSLDSEAEALIQDGLHKLRQGRTTFVIAHRLSTVRTADQILVLDAGRIVERGTHGALMQLNGLYRKLYERQYGLMTDLFINPGEEPPGEEGSDKKSIKLT